MEVGVVVGYLVTFLLGGAARLGDRKLDDLLSNLYDKVSKRLVGRRSLGDLADEPSDAASQRRVRAALDAESAADPAWAAEIAALQTQLDRMDARRLFVQAPGSEIVVGVNHGVVVRNGTVIVGSGTDGLENAPIWVKVMTSLAGLLALGGLGVFGYGVLTHRPDFGSPDFMETPPFVFAGFGLFFAGMVIAAVTGMAHALSQQN